MQLDGISARFLQIDQLAVDTILRVRYAIEAIARYGTFRGGILALLRLLRCRPWTSCSIDDVPRKYSIFYRCAWSKAHEEPRLTPLAEEDKEN